MSNRDAALHWIEDKIEALKNEIVNAKEMDDYIRIRALENEIWKLKRESAKRFFKVFSSNELLSMEKSKLERLASKCKRYYEFNKGTLRKNDTDNIIKLKKFIKNKLVENNCIPADYPEDLLIIQRKKIFTLADRVKWYSDTIQIPGVKSSEYDMLTTVSDYTDLKNSLHEVKKNKKYKK